MLVIQYEGECENYIKLKTSSLTLLLPIMLNRINKTMNDSDEVLRWVHQKYGMSQIIRKFHPIEKCILPCCYQLCLTELTKQLMRVMKYEGDCTENMEWVELYENTSDRKKTDLTLLLLMMFDLMDETMNDSDEMWRWVHYKYGMIRNVKKLNSTGWGTALTLLLPMMLNWIHETINESGAVWRLVHLKYGMSRLIQKFHWIIKKCSYIAVTDNVI